MTYFLLFLLALTKGPISFNANEERNPYFIFLDALDYRWWLLPVTLGLLIWAYFRYRGNLSWRLHVVGGLLAYGAFGLAHLLSWGSCGCEDSAAHMLLGIIIIATSLIFLLFFAVRYLMRRISPVDVRKASSGIGNAHGGSPVELDLRPSSVTSDGGRVNPS